jgi:CubicO group peptidase (beta-lactamase class C family)
LRTQAGIPGLSAAITQDGRIVWERGFGVQNLETSTAVALDTLYPVGDLSQTLSSTILLQQCVERGEFSLDDLVQRWNRNFPEPFTTFRQLLSHQSAFSSFGYDPARYAALTDAIAECTDEPYVTVAVRDVIDRLGMSDSVPGSDVVIVGSDAWDLFRGPTVARYGSLLQRTALPYRVDAKGKATRSSYPATPLTAADGLISTVRDLARFDDALNDGILLRPSTLATAWSRSGGSPMGLGWFVQTYKGERVIWHFGLIKDAYSALIVKVPGRGLTFFLLANSDGLSAPFPLAAGDVTVSPFAKVFLGFIG